MGPVVKTKKACRNRSQSIENVYLCINKLLIMDYGNS